MDRDENGVSFFFSFFPSLPANVTDYDMSDDYERPEKTRPCVEIRYPVTVLLKASKDLIKPCQADKGDQDKAQVSGDLCSVVVYVQGVGKVPEQKDGKRQKEDKAGDDMKEKGVLVKDRKVRG